MKISEKYSDFFRAAEKIYSKNEIEFSTRILNMLDDLNLDKDSMATAFFLKSDIKDASKKEIIINRFGNNIAENIALLQRIGKIYLPDTQIQITNLRKLFIELYDDISLIFIKLAERLITLTEADEKESDDVIRISEECLYLYSPIAHRLGIRKLYIQMEDIAFRRLFPEEYRKLKLQLDKKKKELLLKLSSMRFKLEDILKKNKVEFRIQQRLKRLYSIHMKIMNRGVSLDNIFDLTALRVITRKTEDCYLVLGLVHSRWIPIEGRFRDWVTFPKPNGYRSIQTTVHTRSGEKYEIQIRTEEMHREAEYGSAAHWAYKEGSRISGDWINRLREFLENDEYFDNPYELNELLKSDYKRDYIHVLTPKGEIKTLPLDSTPLDFAFSIHSEVGFRTTGARVNGKFVKLKTRLKSGDVVEILTSKHPNPSRDWIEFVKSPKARSKIMIWIKKNEKDQFIEDGKRLWEKFKKRFKKKLDTIDEEKSFKKNLPKVGFKSPDDFYAAVSIKSVKCRQPLLRKLYPEAFAGQFIKKEKDDKDSKRSGKLPEVKVEGLKNIKTKLSGCCHPIKGEKIFAFVTKSREIKIHSFNCKYYLNNTFDKERIKKAEWLIRESSQDVELKIFGYDINKMEKRLNDIANSEKIEILSIKKQQKHINSAIINAVFEIKEINQLNKLLKMIKLHREFISTTIH